MTLIKRYGPKYWIMFVVTLIFLILEAFSDMLQPTLMSYIVDRGIRYQDRDQILFYGLMMIGVALFGAVNALLRNYLSSQVAFRLGRQMREDLFTHVLGFSHVNQDKFDSATLLTRMTNDVAQVQNFTNGMMRVFLKAPILGIGSIIMVARLHPSLLKVYAVLLPTVVLIIFLNMKFGYPLFDKIQIALDKMNRRTGEFLNGIRVVKAFNRFAYEEELFHTTNQNLATISTKAMRLMAIFSPLTTVSVQLSIVYVIWKSQSWVMINGMGVGAVMAFVNYMMQFLFALMIITRVFTMFIRAKASANRIEEVFQVSSEAEVDIELENRKHTKLINDDHLVSIENIRFENVNFHYGNGELTLKQINFEVNRGQLLGIIGSTGSGKTTLINLIARLYEHTEGHVYINDQSINTIALESLRQKIGMVPQKNILFTGTIEDNMRWGKQDATDTEIWKAMALAQAKEFVEAMPKGIQTLIGRGGVNLSGGQKQRLAIARALLKTPDILILDDSTSAVDVITEEQIKEALRNFPKMMTILVAQRLTSVVDADAILVLAEGEIVGVGTHKELMKSCEIYQEIYASQLGRGMA